MNTFKEITLVSKSDLISACIGFGVLKLLESVSIGFGVPALRFNDGKFC